METMEGWKDKQRAQSLFELREGESPLLQFTKVGKGNRINDAWQGHILTVLRSFGDYMGWGSWMNAFCDHIEDYQTTCSEPHGSREMLLSGIQFTEWEGHDRSKTSLTLSGADGGKK